MLIVFTTCPNVQEAESLAKKMVDRRLAACVQILPKMTSIYNWEGEVQEATEHLLFIKTMPEKWDEIEKLIVKDHSYSVPEIGAIDADRISDSYLSWLRETIRV